MVPLRFLNECFVLYTSSHAEIVFSSLLTVSSRSASSFFSSEISSLNLASPSCLVEKTAQFKPFFFQSEVSIVISTPVTDSNTKMANLTFLLMFLHGCQKTFQQEQLLVQGHQAARKQGEIIINNTVILCEQQED